MPLSSSQVLAISIMAATSFCNRRWTRCRKIQNKHLKSPKRLTPPKTTSSVISTSQHSCLISITILYYRRYLASLFTRCSRADLRSKADKALAETSLPCLRSLSDTRTQLPNYHPRNISALIEYFAISPSLPSEQKFELFLILGNRYDNQNLDLPAEVMSSLVLLRLPGEHQKLARTIAKAGPKCTMSKQAVEDVLHGIGLNNITETELVYAIVPDDPLSISQLRPQHIPFHGESQIEQPQYRVAERHIRIRHTSPGCPDRRLYQIIQGVPTHCDRRSTM